MDPYKSPLNFSENHASDCSKYFTPSSSESSQYSSPNLKTFRENKENDISIFSTPKQNKSLRFETKKFFTPQNKISVRDSILLNSYKYSTPCTSKSSKTLRFDLTTNFSPSKYCFYKGPCEKIQSNLMKQTWVDSDTDTASKTSETSRPQDSTLISNGSKTVSNGHRYETNPFIQDMNDDFQIHKNHSNFLEFEKFEIKMKFLNEEFEKMEALEEQMMEMCKQMNFLRKNLIQQTRETYNIAKQFINSSFSNSKSYLCRAEPNYSIFHDELNNIEELPEIPDQNNTNNLKETHSIHLDSKSLITEPIKNRQFHESHLQKDRKHSQDNEQDFPELIQTFEHNSLKSLANLKDNESINFNDTIFIQAKFARLSAFVKGYLTRRLMKTIRVQNLRKIIHDTSIILLKFKNNLVHSDGKLVVAHQDIFFHQELCDKLESACREFYDIFFDYPKPIQMALISQHRDNLKNLRSRNSYKNQSSVSKRTSNQSTFSQQQIIPDIKVNGLLKPRS